MKRREIESRSISLDLADLRADDGEKPSIRGYAAVFDEEAEIWPGFREVVRRGAFAKTLQEGDPLALWNHNSDKVLGRRSAGTLTLKEDDRGLLYQVQPLDLEDPVHRHAFGATRRRDVRGSSFTFRAVRENVHRNASGRTELRELLEVELLEVAPVAFPAYAGTEAQVRSAALAGIDPEALRAGLLDQGLTGAEAELMLATVPDWVRRSVEDQSSTSRPALDRARRELRIAEVES